MASVYILARDKLEQVRAMLSTGASFDPEADHLFDLAIRRMVELDNLVSTGLAPEPGNQPHKAHILMPWLDR